MKFQVVLEPGDEGGYTVYVPSLPGCISEGDTVLKLLYLHIVLLNAQHWLIFSNKEKLS